MAVTEKFNPTRRRSVTRRLDLYELGEREPCAYIDFQGSVHVLRSRVPEILFADVPVRLHLYDGQRIDGIGRSIAPFEDAGSTPTGPPEDLAPVVC